MFLCWNLFEVVVVINHQILFVAWQSWYDSETYKTLSSMIETGRHDSRVGGTCRPVSLVQDWLWRLAPVQDYICVGREDVMRWCEWKSDEVILWHQLNVWHDLLALTMIVSVGCCNCVDHFSTLSFLHCCSFVSVLAAGPQQQSEMCRWYKNQKQSGLWH